MAWVDWVIVIIMAAAIIGGLSQGFFRSACSLAGLVLGLVIAAWNFGRVSALIMPLFRIRAAADAIGFLLIAVLVMAVFAILGAILAKTFRMLGLGCIDGIAGAAFGFLQGVILVTLGILAIVAFFPDTKWLSEAKLPRLFYGACHISTNMSPAELAHRVRDGLRMVEHESPKWLHPNSG